MIVYGDRTERAVPGERLDMLSRNLADLAVLPAGIGRHADLVAVFIDAGILLQGVLDADFSAQRVDRCLPAVGALRDLVQDLAKAVRASWRSGFEVLPELPAVPGPAGLPDEVELRVPEGYAFYSLYPEAYLDAARALSLSGPPRVIGIRSIGTGLAALVAAEFGEPPPVTVRPTGHPFDRRIAPSTCIAEELLADPAAHFVVVDEGPGLSGSSFGAVADWLSARGVPDERIAFIPSHGGDLGPMASQAHRARWAKVQRPAADLGPMLREHLAAWLAELLGPLDAPPVDVSGGAWRHHRFGSEQQWPAACVGQERRKFLVRAGGHTWLAKFAGLGRDGQRKLGRARTLHAAGFVPEPRGLVHGFLVERWHGDAALPGSEGVPVGELARYLGTRARLFPAPDGSGAGPDALLAMARHNAGLALGEGRAAALDRWEPLLPALAAATQRVAIDGRLDPHEWLRLGDGRLLKADALDHHGAHDLIGCQDVAWDVAGAIAEFDLDDAAASALADGVGRAAGRPAHPGLIEFLRPCYLAFRIGQATLAAASLAGWPAESDRLNARADAYARQLDRLLDAA